MSPLLLLSLLACEPNGSDTKGGGPNDSPCAEDGLACDGLDVVSCGETVETCSGSDVCVAGAGCATCTPTLTPQLTVGTALTLETGASGTLRARPIDVALAGTAGGVAFTIDGPAEVVDATGTVLTGLDASVLPTTVYLRATAAGSGSLTATFTGGATDCPDVSTLTFKAVAPAPLTGRARTRTPYWESAQSFFDVDPVWVALDPVRHADRVGMPYDVYVVLHKSLDEWATDPSLADVTGTVETGTVTAGSLGDNVVDAWDTPDTLVGTLSQRYDVIVDFGQDGRLDPGDLVEGLGDDDGFVLVADLDSTGPHEVTQVDSDAGLWLRERVYWPTDIATLGPRPLVVISHGNGHDYTWYDYIGQHLASWGYVVMAHSNNTGPGIGTASETTLTNTDWILGHLAEVGDGSLDGYVDGHEIGWIGHSRGGEGIVRAYTKLTTGAFTPTSYTQDDIQFLASIAPTVFSQVDQDDAGDVPYFLIAGTADGDVTGGVDCPQCQFYRIWEKARGPKASAYVVGASHNDFNCCGFADGTGPELLGRDEAQLVAKAYFLALARTWLDHDPSVYDVFRREFDGFHTPQLAEGDEVASTFTDSHFQKYPVIDDFQGEDGDTSLTSSGGAVTTDVEDLYEGRMVDDDAMMTWRSTDSMNGATHACMNLDLAGGASFAWTDGTTPSYTMEVVSSMADMSPYAVLSFEYGQISRHPNTVALAGPLEFGVTLVDAAGVEATVDFGDQGSAPEPYQRTGAGSGSGWADELVTLRIPLADFTIGSALDLTRITAVRFDFGGTHGATTGAMILDNVELSR